MNGCLYLWLREPQVDASNERAGGVGVKERKKRLPPKREREFQVWVTRGDVWGRQRDGAGPPERYWSQIRVRTKPRGEVVVRHLLAHSHKTRRTLYGIEQVARREPALARQPCAWGRGGNLCVCTSQNLISSLFHHSDTAARASKKRPGSRALQNSNTRKLKTPKPAGCRSSSECGKLKSDVL